MSHADPLAITAFAVRSASPREGETGPGSAVPHALGAVCKQTATIPRFESALTGNPRFESSLEEVRPVRPRLPMLAEWGAVVDPGPGLPVPSLALRRRGPARVDAPDRNLVASDEEGAAATEWVHAALPGEVLP